MNDTDLLRYSKHLLLPALDYEGQEKLQAASVAVVGLTGLGGSVAMTLASVGIGQLHLIDEKKVTLEDLARSPIHDENQVGEPTVVSAKERLTKINSQVEVVAHCNAITDESLFTFLQSSDVFVDCNNTFAERFQLNDIAYGLRKRLLSGACVGFEGNVMVFDYRDGKGPCYRCYHEEGNHIRTPCSDQGILASLPSLIGNFLATEVIKAICGLELASFIRYDGYRHVLGHFSLEKEPACSFCS